jgi:hypothetical protein
MRGHRYDRGDGFYQTSGSNQWPSGDPEDSPSDLFECKLCDYSFNHTMYGCNWAHEDSFAEQVRKIIQAHMLWHDAGGDDARLRDAPEA